MNPYSFTSSTTSRTVFESVFIYTFNYFAVANCRHVGKLTNRQTHKPTNQQFTANRTKRRTPHRVDLTPTRPVTYISQATRKGKTKWTGFSKIPSTRIPLSQL
nr:MAG TPA: hypothetical protein [Caudoviricetes sp.]